MMTAKKFVTFFLILVLAYALTNKFVFYAILNDKDQLSVEKETQIVAFGASHGRLSINPSYLGHLENLCVKGEKLIFSYGKLNLLLNRGDKISKVIITVSPSTFSEARDLNNQERESFSNNLLRYEYLDNPQIINQLSDYEGFDARRRNKYALGLLPPSNSELKTLAKLLLGTDLKKLHPGWGKYEPEKGSNLDEKLTFDRIQHHYYYDGRIMGESENQIDYLKKIASLTEKNDIRLILVRTPEHEMYREKIPNNYEKTFNRLMQNITIKKGVHFLDFSTLEINDKYFYDSDHLNLEGSLIFSEVLNNMMKN